MGTFIVFCVIGIIILVGWMLFGESDDNKKSSSTVQDTKNENQEQYVKYAVTAIEKAYKIATIYPPTFLKGRICRVIRFKNTANEEITCNPTYRVAVLYNGKSTYEDVITFSNDENKKKYYGGWTFSFTDNEIFDEYPTYDITWFQLKNRVISELEKRHPEWKVSDLETYSRLRKIKTAMLDEAEESLEILRKKHETSQNVAERNDSWLDIFKEYQNICDLKREAVALFIRSIALYADKRVEVTFVYETELDELMKISENLKSEQEMCSEAV